MPTPTKIYPCHSCEPGGEVEEPNAEGEKVGAIIHNDLEMGKLARKWIPKLLTTKQKRKCVASLAVSYTHLTLPTKA